MLGSQKRNGTNHGFAHIISKDTQNTGLGIFTRLE